MEFLDRTGLTKNNNFGSKMTITRYKNANDIDVYFEEYNWTAKNKDMRNFNAGRIKCPYEPRLYGVGYIGEGKYKMSEGCIKTNMIDLHMMNVQYVMNGTISKTLLNGMKKIIMK